MFIESTPESWLNVLDVSLLSMPPLPTADDLRLGAPNMTSEVGETDERPSIPADEDEGAIEQSEIHVC